MSHILKTYTVIIITEVSCGGENQSACCEKHWGFLSSEFHLLLSPFFHKLSISLGYIFRGTKTPDLSLIQPHGSLANIFDLVNGVRHH